MRFFITTDSYWEAKIDKVIDSIQKTGYKEFFEKKSYGHSLAKITIVLMCQNPALNLKRRIRYVKKDLAIYIDLMLDLPSFLKMEHLEKTNIVRQKIVDEVPKVLAKYKYEDFDLDRFQIDLTNLMTKL